jgi:hypothetical protein
MTTPEIYSDGQQGKEPNRVVDQARVQRNLGEGLSHFNSDGPQLRRPFSWFRPQQPESFVRSGHDPEVVAAGRRGGRICARDARNALLLDKRALCCSLRRQHHLVPVDVLEDRE